MFRHVSLPKNYSGETMCPDVWAKKILAKGEFRGDEMVPAYGHFLVNGQILQGVHMTPRKLCGIRFKDLVTAYGRPGAYMASPDTIVDMNNEFKRSMTGGMVIVPLGDFDYTGYTKEVVQIIACQWCGGNLAPSDELVLTMYYSAIQSLIVAFSKSETIEDQERLAYPLLCLVRSLASLNKTIGCAKNILDTMVVVPCIDDMIQKGLAHVFVQKMPTLEDQVLMLEAIVRRTHRRDESVSLAPYGMFAVFFAVPLLSYYLSSDGALTFKEAKEFLKAYNHYIDAYSENLDLAGVDSDEFNAIMAIAETAFEAPLSGNQVLEFLAHLKENPSASVPWVSFGVLESPPDLVPDVCSGPFTANGKPVALSVVKPLGPTSFTVVGRKGTEWTGIQFKSEGIYTINLMLLGSAEPAVGDSRGLDLKANLRLTLGSDIMKMNEDSYSLAGMHQKHTILGGWTMVADKPLDFKKPILVVVAKERVYLQQDGVTFARFRRDSLYDNERPVLLAFKNVLLTVSYSDEKIHAYVVSVEPAKKPSAFAKLSAKVGI